MKEVSGMEARLNDLTAGQPEESTLHVAAGVVRDMVADAAKSGVSEWYEDEVLAKAKKLFSGRGEDARILIAMLRSFPEIGSYAGAGVRRFAISG